MLQRIDLHFPVQGTTLPTDHGYALYGALAQLAPWLHEATSTVLIGPIGGEYTGNGRLQLDPQRSRLRLRMSTEAIPKVLSLAGKSLDIAGHKIRLGVPQVRALIPAPNLIARLVTMKRSDRKDSEGTKRYMEPTSFLDAVRRELLKLDIQGQPDIPLIRQGAHAGQPYRRVLRVHNYRVIGFTLMVTGLTAEESVRLQENGLGGRKRMGCGFFVGMVPRQP